MWKQEEEEEEEDTALVQKYLVKWNDMGYLHVSWEVLTDLVEFTDNRTNKQVCSWCCCSTGLRCTSCMSCVPVVSAHATHVIYLVDPECLK